MNRYLIIVARDRPELFGTLATIYGQKGEVEIFFDRRRAQAGTGSRDRPERRAQAHRDAELHERGYLVIPRPEMACASR
jgi:hypothetical protein